MLAKCLLLVSLVAPSALATSNDVGWALPLLAEATKQEARNPWAAAVQYCIASRNGITEAQFRLGMLYAFGLGVPEDREAAATLFSVAAEQGHLEAQKMLETIRIGANKLPACVTANVDPVRAPFAPPPNWNATLSANQKVVANIITKIAAWHGVDPNFALSIAKVESGLNPGALSPKSAMGVMQLIPETAARFNVRDAFNASQNIKGGVRYLRWLLDRYQGNVALVAASYNAGEGKVDRYKGIPPYPETQQYVKRVQRLYPFAVHQTEADRWRDIDVFPKLKVAAKKI